MRFPESVLDHGSRGCGGPRAKDDFVRSMGVRVVHGHSMFEGCRKGWTDCLAADLSCYCSGWILVIKGTRLRYHPARPDEQPREQDGLRSMLALVSLATHSYFVGWQDSTSQTAHDERGCHQRVGTATVLARWPAPPARCHAATAINSANRHPAVGWHSLYFAGTAVQGALESSAPVNHPPCVTSLGGSASVPSPTCSGCPRNFPSFRSCQRACVRPLVSVICAYQVRRRT